MVKASDAGTAGRRIGFVLYRWWLVQDLLAVQGLLSSVLPPEGHHDADINRQRARGKEFIIVVKAEIRTIRKVANDVIEETAPVRLEGGSAVRRALEMRNQTILPKLSNKALAQQRA